MVDITVIIATRGEPELETALNSLEDQTYKDFSVLVYNDGGPDLTERINKFIELEIDLIQCRENRGLAYSLNCAILKAKTKYVARMDTDDYCLPYRLEIQKKVIEIYNYDLVGSAIIKKTATGTLLLSNYSDKIKKLSWELCFASPIPHPTFFGRTEVFQTVRYNEQLRYSQDYDFVARANLQGYSIAFHNIPTLIYTMPEGKNIMKQYYQMVVANLVSLNFKNSSNTGQDYQLNIKKMNMAIHSQQIMLLRNFSFSRSYKFSKIILLLCYFFFSLFCNEQRKFNFRNFSYKFLLKVRKFK